MNARTSIHHWPHQPNEEIDMVNTILPDLTHFLNQQSNAREKIELCLWKLEALMNVALMTDNFFKISENNLHNYFMTAADLIEEAYACLFSLSGKDPSDTLIMREVPD